MVPCPAKELPNQAVPSTSIQDAFIGSLFLVFPYDRSLTAVAASPFTRTIKNHSAMTISPQSPKPIRLLVVDDDLDTCANLSDILTDFGYEVRTAAEAATALRMLEEQAFDIALLDLKMPGMDGLQFYRELKHRAPSTVAILITGFVDAETQKRADELGIWRTLSKPIDLPALMPMISEAAGQPLVLVVDDDHDFCSSLHDVLRQKSFRVEVAGTAQEAVQQMNRQEFPIVLVDWKLPDADGLKLLDQIRGQSPQVRTVLLTGHREQLSQRLRTTPHYVDVFFYKPLNLDELLMTLQHWLLQSQQSLREFVK
jgi:DNA-binding NtrC family response regulator